MTANRDGAPLGEAFWRFSLAIYARPGVAEALLTLQDRSGHDVNLMLYALWLGTRRVRLHPEELVAAAATVASLHDAVADLRRLRRRLRDEPDPDLMALRRRVLRLELEAERLVQHRLAKRPRSGVLGTSDISSARDGLATAAANLARYLGDEAGSPEAAVLREALAALTRSG